MSNNLPGNWFPDNWAANSAPVYPPPYTGPRSAIVLLRDTIAEYFRCNDVPAVVAPVGLKYRTFTLNQNPLGGGNRIVVIPGDYDADTNSTSMKSRPYGSLSRETRNTHVVNPRELLHWERPATLSIWSAPAPGASMADEQSAIATVEDLLEQVVRAIQQISVNGKNASAAIEWGDVTITSPPNESSFGAELLVKLIIKGPLLDISRKVVQAQPAIVKE